MESSDRLTRSLRGRVAVVTGGAVRLGAATTRALVARGASVAFTWRTHAAEAEALASELEPLAAEGGAGVMHGRCDITSEADVDAFCARIDERFGRVDLLVNNAAIFERTPIATITLDAWKRHLDVNLTGSFLFAQRVAKRMLAGEGGVIVNVACAGGFRPWPNYIAYSVSKAGVVMLTQVLAAALAPTVRVNAVAPGPVLVPEHYGEAERARAAKTTLLEREGSPDDVVRAILFCWDSDYTTGAVIPVEGGRLLR